MLRLGQSGGEWYAPRRIERAIGSRDCSKWLYFVADGHGGDTNARLVKFYKDDKFMKTWGRKGNAFCVLDIPHAIFIVRARAAVRR